MLACVITLLLASQRIAAEQAAFAAPAAERCVPQTLNRSAVLPGTSLAVTPLPDSYDSLPATQISLLGAPPAAIHGVTVTGSLSGRHSGRLRAYSQGDGASFLPSHPFIAGEAVTVRGSVEVGSHEQAFAFHFTVAHQDVLPHPPSLHPSRDPNEKQRFHSRPDLEPPALVVNATSPQSSPGDIFAAPYAGPGQAGPMIFDEAGQLVWFQPVPAEDAAANLQVQELEGKPVLTWWQGYIPPQGFGEGEEIIDNTSYQRIGTVHAGNGYTADLHDFHITPQDTAVFTVFDPIQCNLSPWGGPHGGAVTDSLFQEVDLRTGLVRREWHSIDHVPLEDSYSSAVTTSQTNPFDFFHLNSIDQLSGGTTLISARNTWAMYELNSETGQVLQTVGGKHSSVKLGPGTSTAYQHDATLLPNGDISIFDNGGVPMVHPQSRALIESLNPASGTTSFVTEFEHPGGALQSGSQGDVQLQPDGNFFVGWGAEPYFSEFTSGGTLLYDAHFHGSYQSYRAYRFPWVGAPRTKPAIAVEGSGAHVTVYASWNGDTRTSSWELLAGSSPGALSPVASTPRSGFETAMADPSAASYVAVQALGANGEALGASAAIRR